MSACIILVNGHPGVGKLTVARQLAKLLPNCKVFDNHLLIDAAAALYERNDPTYYSLRKDLRQSIFQSLIRSNNGGRTGNPSTPTTPISLSQVHQPLHPVYIFTENQSTTAAGRSVLAEYLDFALQGDFKLIYFILSCDTEVNVTRLTSSERAGINARTKLVDASLLRDIRMTEEISFLSPPDGQRPDGLIGEFEIETTRLNACQTAGLIAEYVMDSLREEGWYLRLNKV